MKPTTSNEIRQAFLDFYEEMNHEVVASAPLPQKDNPTLLFTNAGMNQFVDVFLGKEKRPYLRATTSQKCMRVQGKHNDLENVGPSPRHHTFFEMLGNFSFGDYFKEGAIRFGYDFLTKVCQIPDDRLYYTVYTSDDDAYNIWLNEIGVEEERILRMGDETNFWMMGDVGPCGPTSEIHYDWGEEACTCHQPDCSVLLDNDCDRWLEVWNLVFMEYDQAEDGTRTLLPKPGVDTGMGLERLTSVIQNTPVNYDNDLFSAAMDKVQEMLGDSDEDRQEKYVGYRVIADHGRAATFLIADGVRPSADGAGYVLRMVIRRAARFGREIGFESPFLSEIAKVYIKQMGEAYPELHQRVELILHTLRQEEQRFGRTIDKGLARLNDVLSSFNKRWEETLTPQTKEQLLTASNTLLNQVISPETKNLLLNASDLLADQVLTPKSRLILEKMVAEPVLSEKMEKMGLTKEKIKEISQISGNLAFDLYATHGLPLEITRDLIKKYGITIDEPGYVAAREKHALASGSGAFKGYQRGSDIYGDVLVDLVESGQLEESGVEYDPYIGSRIRSDVVALVQDGEAVQKLGMGDKAEIITAATPFYVEAGGEVSDTGVIDFLDTGAQFRVDNVAKPTPGLVIHIGEVVAGEIEVGQEARLLVDNGRRADIRRNHTATHILHRELRSHLGPHVTQQGSLVAPDRLRFDFSHDQAVDKNTLAAIEADINQAILANYPVKIHYMGQKEAIDKGAMALFGEKYGDIVRTVTIGDEDETYSMELCGGLHVGETNDIGQFRFVHEGAVAAGVRRVEAVTGRGAQALIAERLVVLERVEQLLNAPLNEVETRLHNILSENKALQKEIGQLQRQVARSQFDGLLAQVQEVAGIKLLTAQVEVSEVETMREMADWFRDKAGSGVAVLAAVSNAKPVFIATVSDDLIKRGVKAGDIVREVAKVVGGGGGGRPNMAQAGGRDAAKIPEALAIVPGLVENALGS